MRFPLINKLYAALVAALVVGLMGLAVVCDQRGQTIRLMELRVESLAAENKALRDDLARMTTAAGVVKVAAQAQGLICRKALVRQAKIEAITAAKPSLKPEEAVDIDVSKKAIDLLNRDLLAPFGPGLRLAGN